MEEEEFNNEYDALACSIKVEDISSDELNQNILRRLKDNDPELDKLWICGEDQICDELDFFPTNGKELGWLGYFIGKSTTLDTLYISSAPSPACNPGLEGFRRGMGRNNSIRSISFSDNLRLEGRVFQMLDLFFKNTDNLTGIEVDGCNLGPECIRQLSLTLRGFNTSLKRINLTNNEIVDGQLVILGWLGLGTHNWNNSIWDVWKLEEMNAQHYQPFYKILPNSFIHSTLMEMALMMRG